MHFAVKNFISNGIQILCGCVRVCVCVCVFCLATYQTVIHMNTFFFTTVTIL